MASSSVSAYRANDPYEALISSMVQAEREPQFRLQGERAEAERMKGVMKDMDSKISALHTVLKQLTDSVFSPFDAKKATQAQTAGFTATSSDKAAFGSHALKVERLAKSDNRISSQLTAAGTSLRSFFDTNGAQTFSISVASPTTDDPELRVDVSVTVDPEGATDKEILAEISKAINTAMNDAVADGDIKSSQKASSSTVNETSTSTRLSLASGQTGFANRLQFTDSGAGLLSLLELTNNAVASGTGGGQVTAVGTSETDSALNSRIVLDGLTLYRNTNTISDALDGVTLQLKEITTDSIAFSVEPGGDQIRKDVEDFLNKYNAVLAYIQTKSTVDTEKNTRGDFASDSAFKNLRYSMRNDMVRQVAGQPANGPSWLYDLGLETDNDGKLSLKDPSKLMEAIEEDSGAVKDFFSGSDGIATRLQKRLDSYVGINGLMDARIESMDDRIKRLSNQITTWDGRLTRRENELRQQYAKLQEAISLFQGQQQNLNSFYI